MAYADELLAEGRVAGARFVKLQAVDSLLEAGTGWDVIETATGLNEALVTAERTAQSQVAVANPQRRDALVIDTLHKPGLGELRAIVADPVHAAAFIQPALSAEIREQIDWTALRLRADIPWAKASGLLYEAQLAATGKPVLFCVVVEPRLDGERWMPFRLLKYCCSIWDDYLQEHPDRLELPPVVPVVFYQGLERWKSSTELADLFPAETASWTWVPRFEHAVLNGLETESGMEDEHGNRGAAPVPPDHAAPEGEADPYDAIRRYLLETQDKEVVEAFCESLRQYGDVTGGGIMEYAERLSAEGRAAGGRRARLEIVGALLEVGEGWDIIETATGWDESRFLEIRDGEDSDNGY